MNNVLVGRCVVDFLVVRRSLKKMRKSTDRGEIKELSCSPEVCGRN